MTVATPSHLSGDLLAFAGMRPGADLDPQLAQLDRARSSAQRTSLPGGTVERRVEAVTGGVLFDASVPLRAPPVARRHWCRLDEITPRYGRQGPKPVFVEAHDVREQRSREETVGIDRWPTPSEKLLDLADDLFLMRHPPHVVTDPVAPRTSRRGHALRCSCASRTSTSRSPMACRTSVGTRIVGSTERTST